MSLMSPGPGGAALLGGMQLGLQMRKAKAASAATAMAGAGDAAREKRASDDGFQADVKHLVDRFSSALPGDEGLLSYEYESAQRLYPDRQLPPIETLQALVGRGGIGKRADAGKYFENDQAYSVHELDGALQDFIGRVAPEQLLDANGYADAEKQMRMVAAQYGVDVRSLEPYVRELEGRRTVASAQQRSAMRQTLDRQTYVNGEMRGIKARVAMAFPAMSSGSFFGGSPTSRMDPNHLPEFNAITSRAETILRENWSRGSYLSAEQVLGQLRQEFRDVPQLQKPLTTMIGVGPNSRPYDLTTQGFAPAPLRQDNPVGAQLPGMFGPGTQEPTPRPQGVPSPTQAQAESEGVSVKYRQITTPSGPKYRVTIDGETFDLPPDRFAEFMASNGLEVDQ